MQNVQLQLSGQSSLVHLFLTHICLLSLISASSTLGTYYSQVSNSFLEVLILFSFLKRLVKHQFCGKSCTWKISIRSMFFFGKHCANRQRGLEKDRFSFFTQKIFDQAEHRTSKTRLSCNSVRISPRSGVGQPNE